MKIKNVLSLIAISISILFLASCSKEGCTDSTATNYDSSATEDDGTCEFEDAAVSSGPENYTPVFEGDYAALIGINTVTTVEQFGFPFDQEVGVAVAVFSESGALLDAGAVTCEGENLSQQSNNAYVFTPGISNFTGIEFEGDTDWNVSGSAWPGVTISNTDEFSDVGEITSESTVDLASNFTLSAASMQGADSVYFALYGPDNALIKTVVGNPTSYTFTADEVSSLGAGAGYSQVVGLTYNEQVSGGKTYWLINETVRTETVTIE